MQFNIASLIKYQNVEQDIREWIREVTVLVDSQIDRNNWSIDAFHTQRNMKNFLKSVNIRLNATEIGVGTNQEVFAVLEKWMYLR